MNAPNAYRIFSATAMLFCLSASLARAAEAKRSAALTIYSSAQPGAVPPELYLPMSAGGNQFVQRGWQMIPGYAIVKQERTMPIQAGRSQIRFTDVAAQIDPTTVSFASLTDPTGTNVLEQNFQFDLVSTAKLMERYIDKRITVEQVQGDKITTISGTLLSTAGGLVLQRDDGGVQVVSGYSNVQFPEVPGGLITRPTLVWDVVAKKAGDQRVRVTYETKAITWWADYNVIFTEGENANSGLLDIGAWVSIINRSGATYDNAKLKLIAGDVQRVLPPQRNYKMMARSMRGAVAEADAGFQEKSFFEYHLYTLGRPTTLPDNSTKQIELFDAARNVPCEKLLVYYGLAAGYYGVFPNPMIDRNYGTQSNKKVDIYLRFKNEKAIGMGRPLPAGRLRVFQRDKADDSLEFIGEDKIDHTPKDEQVLIKMGSAFDVVGERKQVDFRVDNARDWLDETIEINIRNHKDEPVDVLVKENLYRWVNWEIKQSTHRFEKVDARTVHFPIKVDKDGEVTIRYTVHYSW